MCRHTKSNLRLLKQQGFSLIELMIAIPLGLLVVFAVLQIFTANVQGVNMQNAFSRVQENGRMSTELISRDIRAADYWGCIHDTSTITNAESLTLTAVPSGVSGVTGVENASSESIGTVSVSDGTDTLTLRGSTGFSNAKVDSAMASTTDDIAYAGSSGIGSGDLLLIADCENADVFTSTSSNVDSSNLISHASGFTTSYGIDAQVLAPYVKSYFIAANSSGGSSLYRSENGGTATELVRGVNDLQITYGEDTDSDGSADTFSNATSVSDMDDVVSIKVILTSESGNGVSGTSLERDYTVTTNIRNRTLD